MESLIGHPGLMSHASLPAERRAELGITDNLVRLSVGIEDVDDLIADLDHALAASERTCRADINPSMRISTRWAFLLIFLACTGLMGYGYYLQHWQNLEPCPLCILQRYAFIVVGVVALVAAVHGPGRLGQAIYGLLVALAAGAGAGIAARQTWLQHNPPNVLDCGPDLAYMLGSFHLTRRCPRSSRARATAPR